jgi:hypothetical protein
MHFLMLELFSSQCKDCEFSDHTKIEIMKLDPFRIAHLFYHMTLISV